MTAGRGLLLGLDPERSAVTSGADLELVIGTESEFVPARGVM